MICVVRAVNKCSFKVAVKLNTKQVATSEKVMKWQRLVFFDTIYMFSSDCRRYYAEAVKVSRVLLSKQQYLCFPCGGPYI